ncbi:MAG: class I SAM-dependent methyltransferase [Gemmatimonadota bacterium]
MTARETGWQLTGTAAENYERYMVPAHCETRALDLIRRVGLQPGERVLDVACGTGIVSRYAARRVGHFGKVTGVDINPSMLEVACRVSAYFEPAIEFLEGSAEELPLPNPEFDVVFCQQSLMFFPDREKALKEMHRVLKPGGRIALNVWRSEEFNPVYAQLIVALEKHLGSDAANIMRSPFITKSVAEMRSLFEKAGFQDIRVAIRIDTLRFPSIAELVRQEIESMPVPSLQMQMSEVREPLTDEMTELLKSYVDDYGVACPVQDYVAVATR